MSDGSTWLSVNKSEESFSVDYSSVLRDRTASSQPPIECYYNHSKSIITTALSGSVSGNQILMRLLILESVSNAEHYFRSILSELIDLCPEARKSASNKHLLLGSVEYYKKSRIGYALLEHFSLSDSGNLKKQTKAISGFDICTNSSLDVALSEFDKICQLRHAIAHARGELGSNNCIALGYGTYGPQCINLDNKVFQELVAKVNNTVRAYNSFLFDKTIRRWAKTSVLQGKWGKDKSMFSKAYLLFYSETDNTAPADPKNAYLTIKGKLGRS